VVVKLTGKHLWLGISLILIGVAMLLDRLDVVEWEWWVVVWAIVAALGGIKIAQGVAHRKGGKVFWGTVLLLFGGVQVLDYAGLLNGFPHYMFPFSLPVVLAVVGVAFLAMFLIEPREWQLLVPACAFLGLGTVMILADLGTLSRDSVVDAVSSYWPVGLIVFGMALLLRRRSA
jgi:LiaF transmembrane domain